MDVEFAGQLTLNLNAGVGGKGKLPSEVKAEKKAAKEAAKAAKKAQANGNSTTTAVNSDPTTSDKATPTNSTDKATSITSTDKPTSTSSADKETSTSSDETEPTSSDSGYSSFDDNDMILHLRAGSTSTALPRSVYIKRRDVRAADASLDDSIDGTSRNGE